MPRLSLQKVLFGHVRGVMVVCLVILIITFVIAPVSKLFIAVAIILGLVLSLTSMEELTGGSGLSWLAVPIIVIADFFARAISFDATTRGQSWALTLQFVAAVFFTESIVLALMRSRLERFNAERRIR
jgi:hypothetical protein